MWIERHGEIKRIGYSTGLQEASTNAHEHKTVTLTVSAPVVKLINHSTEMVDGLMRSELDTLLLQPI